MPELVIFDCDGVLVDSEPVANRTLATMLQELGLHLTQAQIFDHFVGYSMAHCMRVVEELLGRAPPQDFLRRLQDRAFAAFRTELQPVGLFCYFDRPRCDGGVGRRAAAFDS